MDENRQAQVKATKLLQPLLDSTQAAKASNGTHSSDSAPSAHRLPVTFRAAAFALNALQHPRPKVRAQAGSKCCVFAMQHCQIAQRLQLPLSVS